MSPALLLALLACRGQDATCTAPTLAEAWPADGAQPISRSATLRVQVDGSLDAADTTVTVQAEGQALSGTVAVADGVLSWTPDALMPAEAEVSWSVDACGATAAGGFVTGTEGEVVDPEGLQDDAFALDLDSATWVEPPGGQVLFGQLFAGQLLLGVQEATAEEIDLIGGAAEVVDGDYIQQDPCIPTFDFEPVGFENNPYVEVGPTTLELEVQGLPVVVQDVHVSGAFSADGDSLLDGSLAAELDAREVAGSVGTSADQLCELLELYAGLSCVECSSDGETACVRLLVEDIEGSRVPALRVVPNEDPQECDEGESEREE